jgi:hypothetical protein
MAFSRTRKYANQFFSRHEKSLEVSTVKVTLILRARIGKRLICGPRWDDNTRVDFTVCF